MIIARDPITGRVVKLGAFVACYIWHLDVEQEGVRKKLFYLRIGKWEFQKKWAVPL